MRRGACVETGYGTRPPPKCRLVGWPVHEVNGFLLVYFDAAGRAPSWSVPAAEREGRWTRTRSRLFRLPAHVQDLAENSVDVGHLAHVRGYREIEELDALSIEGTVLRARYAFRHPRGLLGVGKRARAEADIRVHGLGYSQVEVSVPEIGFRSRQFVLATPSDGDHVDLRVGMCMTKMDGARGFLASLVGAMPGALFDWVMGAMVSGRTAPTWKRTCPSGPRSDTRRRRGCPRTMGPSGVIGGGRGSSIRSSPARRRTPARPRRFSSP